MELDRRKFLGVMLGGAALTAGVAAGCAPAGNTASQSSNKAVDADAAPANPWLGEPPEVSDADCAETVDADVVVVGAGTSGYFAAAAAAEKGAKVVLIEKQGAGNGVRASAIAAIDSSLQKEKGVAIDKCDIINDFARYASNRCNMKLLRLWADNSGETIDWYRTIVEPKGLTVELEWNMPKEHTRFTMWPTGHGTVLEVGKTPDGGSMGEVTQAISDAFDEYIASFPGCEVRYNTAMLRLIDDGGRITGLYAEGENGKMRLNASKGVILATGGYAANEDMFTALQGDFAKSFSGAILFPSCVGEGIKAAMWAGAKLEDYPTCMLFDRGLVTPDTEIGSPYGGGEYFSFGSQPFLKVNGRGERFCNESSPYMYVAQGAAKYEGRAWYPIWDSSWKEDVERFYTVACSTLVYRDGGCHDPGEVMGLDAIESIMDGYVESGHIVKADTIEELAQGLGLAEDNVLPATVKRYNELFAKADDADFGKEPFRLSGVDEPPYYGMKLGGNLLCTLQGICTNESFQAVNENLDPIEGLYVVGNDGGNYYGGVYPNYAAGTNAGRCATFGRLCGRMLAGK